MPSHGGSPNGGSTPPPAPDKPFAGGHQYGYGRSNNYRSRTPITSITKSVSYLASGTDSNQILAISGTDSSSVTTADAPKAVVVSNTGTFPVVAMLGYEAYIDENTDTAATLFVHTLLLPGESIYPNMRGVISVNGETDVNTNSSTTHANFADQSLWNLDGEVLDYTVPNTNLYTDSTENCAGLDNTTDPVTLTTTGTMFRVADLIRVENEIMEITAISGGSVTVKRGLFGSTTASHSDATDIRFPFFNEHYDYDRVLSGNTQLVQTDAMGRFKCSNFFGYGRVDSDSAPFGLVPGSVCIRFYTSAYQDIPMGGTGASGGTGGSNIPITSSTSSMLSTSTEYSLNLIIDDSTETTVSFTTSSSNVNFGGTGGIISVLQDAIDTATRTAGNNLFGYSCSIGIVNSKLRFTSNSHLLPHDGTNGSKIEVKDGAGGTNVLTGAAGIFPDINNSIAAVKPQLPDLNVYDPITYVTSPNMGNICYDDSYGHLRGAASGTVNYETGAISFTGLANASFEVSVVHNSPFGGKVDANKSDANTLKSIHANTLNKNMQGKIKVETF